MSKALFKKPDLKRAIEAALSLGLNVSGFLITRDGDIQVNTDTAELGPDAALRAWERGNAKNGA